MDRVATLLELVLKDLSDHHTVNGIKRTHARTHARTRQHASTQPDKTTTSGVFSVQAAVFTKTS
eukprot:COSAG06_NODE_613_length_13796_cov_45.631525_18_plen_64_part_00